MYSEQSSKVNGPSLSLNGNGKVRGSSTWRHCLQHLIHRSNASGAEANLGLYHHHHLLLLIGQERSPVAGWEQAFRTLYCELSQTR